MGICAVQSAGLYGVEAQPVTVEVSLGSGLPGIAIVGMADTAVQEAKERVRSAIREAGFAMPSYKVVVNLAPSNVKKSGSGFDLPIALGILIASGQLSAKVIEGKLIAGELSLQGNVRPVRGSLALAICAKKMGFDYLTAMQQPAPIEGLVQLGLPGLGTMHLSDPFEELRSLSVEGEPIGEDALDYKDIYGHDVAKRALQVAAAGIFDTGNKL